MKIIKPGRTKKPDKRFICRWCDCEFMAEESEYKYYDTQYNNSIYVCKCPCCGRNAFNEE